ncbi:diguanylate cyclase [Thermosipho ferrireducens]|uniref:Diguanylate cyclase n=1 Tax=Thermosipho ferrireducens TaxID=2571116 RepID=A0ABX7S7H6_9BACT|nr:diguanylate cyclase [Thermosipho ferrireducens]QTA37750.1 diguanylate cyclase [Thermosipho ferrireducens]
MKLRIWLPALIGIILFLMFVSYIFLYIIPGMKNIAFQELLERTKVELQIATKIVDDYYRRYKSGELSKQRAMEMAISEIEKLRYGYENRDYFWIVNLNGELIAHPYYTSLKNKPLEEINDPVARSTISEIVEAAKNGETFVEYRWYVYETKLVEEKISAIEVFKPWDWIIGTGVYEYYMKNRFKELTSTIFRFTITFFVGSFILLGILIFFTGKAEAERKEMVLRIENERKQLETLVLSLPQPVALKNSQLKYIYINDAFSMFAGKVRGEIIGYKDSEIFKEKDYIEKSIKADEKALKTGNSVYFEYCVNFSGENKWYGEWRIPVVGETEKFKSIICIINEITKYRKETILWQEKAELDELTKLANRTFLKRLLKEFDEVKFLTGKKLAVLMADLDGFKKVNDTYGHLIGDKVLEIVAKRLKESVRKDTILIRYGGDEFLIIIPEIDKEEEALMVAKRIRENVNRAMKVEGKVLELGICIGISIYPDDGITLSKLIDQADKLLYEAKLRGKNQVGYKTIS